MSPHIPTCGASQFCDPLSYHTNTDTLRALFAGGNSKPSLMLRQLFMFAIYTLENQGKGESESGEQERLGGTGVLLT